jgi:NitT/TauT family transport system ATP-binding protein
MTDRVLTVSGLSYTYADRQRSGAMIRDVSLWVGRSEIVAIVGASGCGKTTLLNLIAGLLTPQSGTINITGGGDAASRIGYIFQQDPLFPWQTVEKNLMLAARITGNKQRCHQQMEQYLRTFNLDANILKLYPSQLSGGMRQRVSIIQSLMFNPDLLLLDEPFSALDFCTKLSLETEFYQLVKDHQKAAVLVTHDIDEAIAMSDRVLVMSRGGVLIHEFVVKLGEGRRLPETVRGTPEFANLYSRIWSELKAVA